LSTATELHVMPKRQLADRILDEILTLRRPRPLVLEFDEHQDEKSRQDQVLNQTTRRQLIVE
ncbi:MAG: hypothetical protein ABSC47_00800, partial [Terracidiphilus sp.]